MVGVVHAAYNCFQTTMWKTHFEKRSWKNILGEGFAEFLDLCYTVRKTQVEYCNLRRFMVKHPIDTVNLMSIFFLEKQINLIIFSKIVLN